MKSLASEVVFQCFYCGARTKKGVFNRSVRFECFGCSKPRNVDMTNEPGATRPERAQRAGVR